MQKANIVRHPWCWFGDDVKSWNEFLGIYIVAEGIGVKESQFAFDGFELVDPSHWYASFDVVACASYACISSKVKIFCILSVNLEVHI